MTDLGHARRRHAGRAAAAALVLATVLAVLNGAPAPTPGVLALAAVATAGHRLVSRRRRGGLDALLVGVGGVLVGIVLTGIVLALTEVGLRPATWAWGLAGLATLGLVVDLAPSARAASSPADRGRGPWLTALRGLPWLVGSVAVVAVAVGGSVRSLAATDQPPLAMSLSTVDRTDVRVLVSTGDAVGPLELRSTSGGTDVSYPLFDLPADGSRTITLSLPLHGRVTITLNNPDQTQPLRTLILDR